MIKSTLLIISLAVLTTVKISANGKFESDIIKTDSGDLEIIFIGHASLIFKFTGRFFYVDPYGDLADYSKLPRADAIICTHDHVDHFDLKAIKQIQTKDSIMAYSEICSKKMPGGIVLKNSESGVVLGVKIEAVPAYNIVHKRKDGNVFHPRGDGNGYILTFGNKRVYVAGDTENIPEMKNLKDIDIAFLPTNLPYTMTPEMTADAAKSFNPKILYPYHYGETDVSVLEKLLKGSGIEVRIRNMK